MTTITVSKTGTFNTFAQAKAEILKIRRTAPTEPITVEILEGIWTEGVIFPPNVIVKGQGEKTIVQPPKDAPGFQWQGGNVGDVGVSNLHILMPVVTNGIGVKMLSDNGGTIVVSNVRIQNGYKNIVVQSKNKAIEFANINNNILLDSNGNNTAGLFLDGVKDYEITNNLIDRAGYLEKDIFCHGMYIQHTCGFGMIANNLVTRSSAHGIQQRGGGELFNNFLYRNPCGMYSSNINGTNIIRNNVIIESSDISPILPRGWGVEVFPGNSIVENNTIGNLSGRSNRSIFGKTQKPDYEFISGLSNIRNNKLDIPIRKEIYAGMALEINNNIENAVIPTMEQFVRSLVTASETSTPIEDFINCLRNGHIKLDPSWTNFSMNKIIDSETANNTKCPQYGLPGETKIDHVLKWAAILEIISPLERGSVLDLGCGQHDFPLILQNLGFQTSCVEKNRISNNVRNSKVSCHTGDVFEYLNGLDDNSLDYATDGCSIIHFDISTTLAPNVGCQRISELLMLKLKPGGKLIIACDFLKTLNWGEYNDGEFLYLGSLIKSFHLGGLGLVGELPTLIDNPYSFEYNKMNLCICRLVFEK